MTPHRRNLLHACDNRQVVQDGDHTWYHPQGLPSRRVCGSIREAQAHGLVALKAGLWGVTEVGRQALAREARS